MFIKNAVVITFDDQDRIIENGGVLIDPTGKITTVGRVKDIEPFLESDEKVIDAKGKLLMPGNICAHTHFYGVYSRGLYIPGDAPNAFPQILENRGPDYRRMSMWAFINPNYDSSKFMNGQYPMGPVADIDFMMEIFRFFRE